MKYSIACSSVLIKGDKISFSEPVVDGLARRVSYQGDRQVEAEVSHQQGNAFLILITESSGTAPLPTGVVVRRTLDEMSRNKDLRRQPRLDELNRLIETA